MKKSFTGLAIIPGIALVLLGISYLSDPAAQKTTENKQLTVGMESTLVNSLIYLAQANKYFEQNGLDVTIKDDYPSGAAAAESMLKGEVDIATAAELALVRQAFAGEEVQTFASIDRLMHMYIVSRKDRGIRTVSDLQGKKIGVPAKTAADFKLGRYLELGNVAHDKVSILDVQAPQAVDSLVSGDVDAVVTWHPNVLTLKEKLGKKVNVWSVQNDQPMYCLAITTGKFLKNNPKVVAQFVDALAKAEDFLINNPDQARATLQKSLKYDDKFIDTIWPDHQLSLSLDQSLTVAMEDQARWMIKSKLIEKQVIPDFQAYVHTDKLIKVRPASVRVINK